MIKDRVAIGNRIKQLRKTHKFSQTYIAGKLFISQAAYSLIENSQNGIVADHIIKLSELYDVTADYILTGNTLLVKISPANGFVPFIKANAYASFIKSFKEGKLEEYEWCKLPGSDCVEGQKLFEVEGKSMLPSILPGDIVICQIQPRLNDVLDGSIVLVITNESIFIKRLRFTNNPEVLLFESDNHEAGEEGKIKVRKADISELMMVRGKISHALAPAEMDSSNQKIEALEQAIQLLKQELSAMNVQVQALK